MVTAHLQRGDGHRSAVSSAAPLVAQAVAGGIGVPAMD
jgi:hypothetical protein